MSGRFIHMMYTDIILDIYQKVKIALKMNEYCFTSELVCSPLFDLISTRPWMCCLEDLAQSKFKHLVLPMVQCMIIVNLLPAAALEEVKI